MTLPWRGGHESGVSGVRSWGAPSAAVATLLVALFSCGCHRLAGRGGAITYDEATFASKVLHAYSIPAPDAKRHEAAPTLIGRTRTYRIREGDTLLDVARYYDLGYNEIVEANPEVDPWLPPVGTTIILPTSWILPCCAVQGIVLNVPEMRLYFYRREPADAPAVAVITHPIGIGPREWRTPRGKFEVRGKTVNPVWVIPDSIRQARIREHGDARRAIPGGDPENPLGEYRLELTLPRYGIHGTNAPWGVGRQVSHGCARLYPEDIERMFPLVAVGTPVELTYQPVKVGAYKEAVYLEVHPDIYGYGPPTYDSVLALLERRGLSAEVDTDLVRVALTESLGMPVRVSRDPEDASDPRAKATHSAS